jgi:S1-C subfamily serine protease
VFIGRLCRPINTPKNYFKKNLIAEEKMKGKVLTISVVVIVAVLVMAAAAFAGSQLVFAKGNNIIGNFLNQVAGTPAAQAPAVKGLVAVYINAGGPADTAGVKRGDILLKINDTEVNTAADVRTALSSLKVGDMVNLTVTHGDEQKSLSLKLGDNGGKPDLGMTLVNGTRGVGGFGGGKMMRGTLTANGALVVSVEADSPASAAGLKQGDVILSVDGTAIDSANTLASIIAGHKAGDKVTLSVQSGAATNSVPLTLGDKSGKAYLGVQYQEPFESSTNSQGQAMPMPFGRGRGFTAPNGVSGVVVNNVVAGGPAEKAGLKNGDVISKLNGTAVTSANDFVTAIGNHKVGDTVTVTVTHQGDSQTSDITVTLGENPSTTGKAYLGVGVSDGGMFFHKVIPNDGNGNGSSGFPFPGRPFQQPSAPSTSGGNS